MVVVNEHDNHDRQRLDSSLVYTGAHNVYYVKSCLSDAHFSREYSRMFGESPKRDITRLRKSVGQL